MEATFSRCSAGVVERVQPLPKAFANLSQYRVIRSAVIFAGYSTLEQQKKSKKNLNLLNRPLTRRYHHSSSHLNKSLPLIVFDSQLWLKAVSLDAFL
jgi:hypothetical protein